MKSLDLVLVTGNKASDKYIFQMLSGKNVIGTNIKCSTQIDQELIKPMHFELLITKSCRITIIPLVSGMQIMQKNKKLKELEVNQCYDLEAKQSFYIERTYACYLEETSTKKAATLSANKQSKQSIWSIKNIEYQVNQTSQKKLKKETPTDFDDEIVNELTQSKQDESGDNDDEEYSYAKEEELIKEDKKKRKTPSNQSKISKKIKSPNSCDTTRIAQHEPELKIEEEQKIVNKQKKNKQLRVILSNCDLTANERNKMIKLGVTFVENQEEDFDIVVMDEFRRRAKMLIGLNKRAWILSKGWILDCIDDNELIEDFIEYAIEVSNEDKERYDNFDLDKIQCSIQKSKGFKIFENSSFILQDQYKNIQLDDLQAIIKSGGGKIIQSSNPTASFEKQKLFAIIEEPKKIKNPMKNTLYVELEYVLLSTLKQQIQTKYIKNI